MNFVNNTADCGGAIYTALNVGDNINMNFSENTAKKCTPVTIVPFFFDGGAVVLTDSLFLITGTRGKLTFCRNSIDTVHNGGATHLERKSEINLNSNNVVVFAFYTDVLIQICISS